GPGDDLLTGGQGRDLLFGGGGADGLNGGPDDDLLIGGSTAFDANDLALRGGWDEGNSSRDYQTRIDNPRGTGSGPRLNGNFFLKAAGPGQTVFDDGASDTLTGGSGRDWFFANLDAGILDVVVDLAGDELFDDPL